MIQVNGCKAPCPHQGTKRRHWSADLRKRPTTSAGVDHPSLLERGPGCPDLQKTEAAKGGQGIDSPGYSSLAKYTPRGSEPRAYQLKILPRGSGNSNSYQIL